MRRDSEATLGIPRRPGLLTMGAAALAAVLVGFLALSWLVSTKTATNPDLGPLLDEPIWSAVPPDGNVLAPVAIVEECTSGTNYAHMRVVVPSGDSGVAFYEDIARQTGWTVNESPYPGATKRVGDQDLWLSFDGSRQRGLRWEVEVTGNTEPDGC